MRRISPKTGGSYSASFNGAAGLLFACLLTAAGTISCTTAGKDARTADGQIIPGKKFFQFAEYEYLCEPTFGKTPPEMEQLLDRYGASGWRLAGFMQKNGDTHAFCMMR